MCCSAIDMGIKPACKGVSRSHLFGNGEQRQLVLLTFAVTLAVLLSALCPGQEPELLLALIAVTVYAVQELRRKRVDSPNLGKSTKVVHLSQGSPRAQMTRQSSSQLEAGLPSAKPWRHPRQAQPKSTRAYDQPWRQQAAPQAKPTQDPLRPARSMLAKGKEAVKPSDLPWRTLHPQTASPHSSLPLCMLNRLRM
mmetsp:Transcript_51248/g.111206  ORF Transcript_51248/g.111206 Transcript_51248/m.111206 type:complete len:195 (+) Transcript_51248:78-662(+)